MASEVIRPTDPNIVLEPLLYLWSVAPATADPAYAYVLAAVRRWLAGDDPFPNPPPDDEGHRPAPPKPDPPAPAYPILDLLSYLEDLDPSTFEMSWMMVADDFFQWIALK